MKSPSASIRFQQSAAYQRKANVTRARLMDAAINVIAAVGAEQASIQEITKFAGMAVGTFYLYFQNKDDLLEQIGVALIDSMRRVVHDPQFDHDDPAHLVARHVFIFLGIAGSEPTWIPVLMSVMHATEKACAILAAGIRSDIERGCAINRFDVMEDAEVVAIMLAICRNGLERILDGADLPTIQAHAVEAALRVLGIDLQESRVIASEVVESPMWESLAFPTVSSSRTSSLN